MDLVQLLVEVTCNNPDLQTVLGFIKGIVRLLCLIIPVGLIIFGTIDLGKAVISSDEKEIKGATGKLIKRAIAAVVVFFIPTIVGLVMNLVGQSGVANTDWAGCWNGGTVDNTQNN